jgi:hypothetical protein
MPGTCRFVFARQPLAALTMLFQEWRCPIRRPHFDRHKSLQAGKSGCKKGKLNAFLTVFVPSRLRRTA